MTDCPNARTMQPTMMTERSWPSSWSATATANQSAMPDPNRSTLTWAATAASVGRPRRQRERRQRARHDCGCVPPRHCARNGSAVRTDRSRRCGRCDTVRFCIWDGAADCAARACRVQTGISRRICIRRPPRTGGTVPSCSCRRKSLFCVCAECEQINNSCNNIERHRL